MCLLPLSSPGAVAPGSANPKASILVSGPVVRTPRWAFLGLTLLRIGPLSSQLVRAAAIALRPCWWTVQLLGELDHHLLRWLPLLLVPQFARAVRCCMSAPNQSLLSLPVPLAPQTLLGLPDLARLPLHPVGPPRLPPVCGDFLLDYSLDRGLPRGSGGAGWGDLLPAPEVPGPLSRRDGLLAMLPGPPPIYAADGSSPLLRSKDPNSRAIRSKPCGLPPEAVEGLEVHPNPLLWMPPPTRIPPAGERGGHKNLALEGLRDWYIRNSGLAVGPQRRPMLPHVGPTHTPFLHARCYEVGQSLYGPPSQAPLPHSRSFTAPPVSGRYGGAFTDG